MVVSLRVSLHGCVFQDSISRLGLLGFHFTVVSFRVLPIIARQQLHVPQYPGLVKAGMMNDSKRVMGPVE